MQTVINVEIPYKFTPREYQIPVLAALDSGKKRVICVWHRRSGKDKTFLNYMVKRMFDRVGAYYYFFPTYTQGKKILWEGADRLGFKYMDHFPDEIIAVRDGKKRKNSSTMFIELVNGSTFQIIGTDNYDSIRGTNPVGCAFSEFSYQSPICWDIVRPILQENGGWSIFNLTPQGKNHAHTLYMMAKDNSNWFCELLTVDDTRKPDGTPVFSKEEIDEERREGVDEDFIQQEYYCSFDAAIRGAYYGQQIRQAVQDKRMTVVDVDKRFPVHTAWDLGIGDSMAIWFVQLIGREVRLVDYYESSGQGVGYYIKYLQGLPYMGNYGDHWAPHDIEVRELTTGKTRWETARNMGITFRIVPKLPVDDGIDAVRRMFKNCVFDEKRCDVGINALICYRKEYDEKRLEFKNIPYHDWASHAADAFRYLAIVYQGDRRRGEVGTGQSLVSAGYDG